MPDHSSSTPTDRVTSRGAGPLVRWLRASVPALRPRSDQEPSDQARLRTMDWGAGTGRHRSGTGDAANAYVHYREVKEALRRNLDFAAAVGANASSRVQERMARRVSRLQVKEDQAVVAMRRQDRSWSGRGFLGVFHHSDGTPG